MTAIVLVDCVTGQIPQVAKKLANLGGVAEVYSVAGDVDLVAIVRVREFEQVEGVITGGIAKVDGVTRTRTHVAMHAYSRDELDEAFAIGFQPQP